jgi:mitogen-activated protein kinase 7
MELANPENFNEMCASVLFLTLDRFLVQDLMEADLHQIIRSQQSLSEQHFQFFIYQICKG